MRVLLLGHGRMGQLVESLAPAYGGAIAGVIDEHSGDRAIADATGAKCYRPRFNHALSMTRRGSSNTGG